MKRTLRRLCALILALSLCLSLFSASVRAADDTSAQSDESLTTATDHDPADSGDVSAPADQSTSGGSGEQSGQGGGSSSPDTSDTSESGGQQTSEEEEEEQKTSQEQKTEEEEEEADSKSDQEEQKPAPAKPVNPTSPTTTTTTTTTTTASEDDDPIDLERMCGEELEWSLGGTTLTVTGSGAMWNFDGSDRKHFIPPWDEAADFVKKVIIGAEVSSVGTMAFQSCVNLEEVEFQSALTTYPKSAFYGTPWWRLAQFRKSEDLAPDTSVKLSTKGTEDVYVYTFAPTQTDQYRLTVTGSKGAKVRASLYDEQGGVLFRERTSHKVSLERVFGTSERVFLLLEPLSDGAAKYTVTASTTSLPPLMGTCGDNLTWVLDAASETLTISGKGKMDEYKDRSRIPWRDLSPIIATLKVENGVTTIGRSAFEDCASLAVADLPGSLERVGNNAFAGCARLEQVNLSAAVKVPENAFADTPWAFAQRLNAAQPLSLDQSVSVKVDKSNAANVFRFTAPRDGFYRLDSADVKLKKNEPKVVVYRAGQVLTSGAAPQFSAEAGDELLVEVNAAAAVPKGAAWTETLSLVAVDETLGALRWTLEDGTLTVSGSGAMKAPENGYPWEHLRTQIVSVKVENGVKNVSKGAFEYCTALTSLSLADSVESVDEGAFYDCPYLSHLELGSGLKSIGRGAFNSCYALMSLSLPDSVKSVDEYAFAQCTALKEVTLKKGLNYPENAFAGTPWQRVSGSWAAAQAILSGVEKTVILNKAKPRMYFTFTPLEDGFYLFSSTSTQDSGNPIAYLYTAEGTELARDDNGGEDKDFILGSTLRQDTTYVFCAATSPEAKGKRAYSYDVGLQSTPLPTSGTCGPQLSWTYENGLLTITGTGRMDNYASAAATPWAAVASDITTVKMEEGVGTIGSFAFDGMSKLSYAEVPEGVVSIGSSAFSNCIALKNLSLPATLRSLGGNVFDGMDTGFTVVAEPGSFGHVYARRSGLLWVTPAAQKEADLKAQG